MTTATYYFNSYDAIEKWVTWYYRMVDGLITSGRYAKNGNNADVQLNDGNTCDGTDLGTITKVELRVYAGQSVGSSDILVRPVFGGSTDGDDYAFAITATSDVGSWIDYQDITNDANAPATWGWSDIQNLECDVYRNSGAIFVYVHKIEIRVTYASSDDLTADDITAGVPVLGTPTLVGTTVLIADDIASGTPVLGTPTLNTTYTFDADDIVAGAPILGTPTLSRVLDVTYYFSSYDSVETAMNSPANLVDGDEVSVSYNTSFNLGRARLNANTCPGSGLGEILKVEVRGLEWGGGNDNDLGVKPIYGGSDVGTEQFYTVLNVAGKDWTAYLDVTNGTNAPATWSWADVQNLDLHYRLVSTPSWHYIYKMEVRVTYSTTHILTADDITAGTPVLGEPTLSKVLTLDADDIVTGAPVVGDPVLGVIRPLTADDITTGTPVLGTPTLNTTYTFDADDIVAGAPILGTPTLNTTYILTADDIVAGAPVVGEPTLNTTYILTADDIVAGAPVVGEPTLVGTTVLIADDIASGTPVLGTPTLVGTAVLIADDIASGSPILRSPILDDGTEQPFSALSIYDDEINDVLAIYADAPLG